MNPLRYIVDHARIFTLLVIVVPIIAGTYAYQTLPKEGEPEISAPLAIVITPYQGASPSEIESLVTTPLEEELGDIKHIKEMRSSSTEGVSVIVVEFDVDADLERSIQRVREKVTEARSELPDDVDESSVEEISLTDIPIMLVSIVGDLDPIHLRRLAENVADEIELLPEVLSTDVAGGLVREIQIYLEPEKLTQYGLTLLDVYNAVKSSDINIPGGMVNVAQRRFLLRTLTEIKNVDDYARVPLIRQGDRVVYLSDVAKIVDGHEEDISFSRVDGIPSVSIGIKKRTGANILETAAKVQARLIELEREFPQGVRTIITANQAKFIQQTFDIMNNSAATGLIIVIIVLYFAMGLRNSVITSLAIPLSLLFTFILLKTFGLTNNNMVRFSLVLCIGLLVDNAIIVVENAYHHYQLGKDRLTSVIDGISEIALPVVSATLTTLAAFLPMLLMTGTTGEYMSFMPKTVTLALCSSLIVALIAGPLVLSRFMSRSVQDGTIVSPEHDLRRLKRWYVRGVSWALNHRFIIVVLTILSLAWAGGLIGMNIVKIEMFPDVDFDYIYITIETPPGTDVDVTNRIAGQVEHIVKTNVPEAVRVVSTVGARPPSAFEIQVGIGLESNYGEITVELADGKEIARANHKEIQARIRPLLDDIPGTIIRFRPLAWGPPRFAPVVVSIIGPDLDVLRRLSFEVKQILENTPGARDIKDDFSDAPPELRVNIDRMKAAKLGVPLDVAALNLRGATAGLDVKDFRDELDVSKKYKLKVRYAPEERTSPDMLDRIRLRSTGGALVPLNNIADFEQGPGVNTIRHVDRRRVVRTTAQNEGRSAVEISKELKEKIKDLALPPGYTLSFEGEYKDTEESFASLKLAYLMAFLLIFTLLVAQFNSYFQPFAIMTALPLSVVGGMIGLLVTNNNFSIFGFVGLVGLTGIVVNDSIVLVDCINRFCKQGMGVFEAIVQAGQQRLRPILSTTLTTIGGIITLTMTDELWEGLGVVIIFGIAFATVLTLVVVPVMYSLFEGLGLHVKSALTRPDVHDAPQGRPFCFTRRRGARTIVVAVILLQLVVFITGAYYMVPMLASHIQSVTVQAPSLLKWVIEATVFGLGIVARIVAALLILLIPSCLGWLYLAWRKNQEYFYLDVRPEGVMLSTPVEKTVWSASTINVVYRRLSRSVIIESGRRRLAVKRVLSEPPQRKSESLLTWLSKPAPTRKQINTGLAALLIAVEGVTRPAPFHKTEKKSTATE
jgi:multidrug efflux pump